MRKRIYGLECETALHPYNAWMQDPDLVHKVMQSLHPCTRAGVPVVPLCEKYFMANGGRFYLDGGHYEITTQECKDVHDLVVCNKANERILEDIAFRVNFGDGFSGDVRLKRLRAIAAPFGGFTFLKNSIALNANPERFKERVGLFGKMYTSYGNHLNVLFDRKKVSPDEAVDILAPFSCASHWFTGSGFVLAHGNRLKFSLSQRAPFVKRLRDINAAAEDQKRPMFMLRNRPWAAWGRYYRLQIVGFDASLCEWPLYVAAGIVGLLLRMAEDGFIRRSDYCGNDYPRRADFERDCLEMKDATLWLGTERDSFQFHGRDYDAASLHREWYLDRIRAYKASDVSWSDEEEDVVQKYESLIAIFEKAQSSEELAALLAPFVDQAAKLHYLIFPDMRRRGYSFASRADARIGAGVDSAGTTVASRLRLLDTQYHDVRRDKGLYHLLVRKGLIECIASDTEIERAKEEPLPGTRAVRRDYAIRALMRHPFFEIDNIAWTKIQCYERAETSRSNKYVQWQDENPFEDAGEGE